MRAFVSSVLLLAVFAPIVSHATFESAARQIEANEKAAREADALAAIPGENQRMLQHLERFAKKHGGLVGQPQVVTNSYGAISKIELVTADGYECKEEPTWTGIGSGDPQKLVVFYCANPRAGKFDNRGFPF